MRPRRRARFAESRPPMLREVTELRNQVAHTGRVPGERVRQFRAHLAGVGRAGVLVELAGEGDQRQ